MMAMPVIYYVTSDEAANALIVSEEVKTGTRFCARKSRNLGVTDIQTLDGRKIWWVHPKIPFDGVPFVVIGVEIRGCEFGPDLNQFKGKGERQMRAETGDSGRKRRKVQPSKKSACPAQISITKVFKFPDMKLQGNNTKNKRCTAGSKLRESFPNVLKEYRVYINFPALEDHKPHMIGPEAAPHQRLDQRVTKKIHDLVHQGLRDLAEVKKHVEIYVQNELVPQFGQISMDNRRFYPNERTVRNHVNTAVKEIEKSSTCKHAQTVHRPMRIVEYPEVVVDDNDDVMETIVIETGDFDNHQSDIRQKCLDTLRNIESRIHSASEASLPEIYKQILSVHELVNRDGIHEMLLQHLLKESKFKAVNLKTTMHNDLVEFDGVITMDIQGHSV